MSSQKTYTVTTTRDFSNGGISFNCRSYEVRDKYKIVIIGDSGVGKTAVMERFTEPGEMKKEYQATIGVEFKQRAFSVDGHEMSLYIWDTAGQERFKSITQTYYKGAMGAIIMYSVDNRKSFEHIDIWLEELENVTKGREVSKIIVGNKNDLDEERQVGCEEARKKARKLQMPLMETSALTYDGIDNVFGTLAWHIKNRVDTEKKREKEEQRFKAMQGGEYDDDADDRWRTISLGRSTLHDSDDELEFVQRKKCAC